MNTPAIHQAIRLEKYPEEMAWLCLPDSDFPEGITDLLRLCASQELLIEFAENNGLESGSLKIALYNFVIKAIVKENNNDEKILGTDNFSSSQVQKFHYQLLMKIFHPDVNNSSDAGHYATIISKAYQRLKDKEKEQDSIRFSEHRKPSKQFYQATKKAEAQISATKTAMAFFSALTIIALVALVGKLYDPANPEILTKNDSIQDTIIEPQKLVKITMLKSNSEPTPNSQIHASSSQLQVLLKELESAYEIGNVEKIKPILANAPEIKNQSDTELHNKLETLFEITTERKMVLFDFSWKRVDGKIEGKGKFLSRYQLVGEKKWLTREGTASVIVTPNDNVLKVTQLVLANQTIE